ncbi:hypothetical protein HPB50_013119 [Hyalomma asiaticum]|uniref:Uncharacterized protein n=1 Tax=Hyalomma asiaticum TaxID=266040 RepID=A0ACB7S5C2_HYAAI|nr:hypothetical protein HPB50_013119 [Hyalomma asiaticum]
MVPVRTRENTRRPQPKRTPTRGASSDANDTATGRGTPTEPTRGQPSERSHLVHRRGARRAGACRGATHLSSEFNSIKSAPADEMNGPDKGRGPRDSRVTAAHVLHPLR